MKKYNNDNVKFNTLEVLRIKGGSCKFIYTHIEPGTKIITDGWNAYSWLDNAEHCASPYAATNEDETITQLIGMDSMGNIHSFDNNFSLLSILDLSDSISLFTKSISISFS